ncbi:6,7-dimethyl-8-ribityllumazine synthase [Ilyomonas limi]|uniref:6,7-dimethyl-8-ribityllumazine synthase n=1 Tax=Ilyomonas limi TaxID=2575867 RepID=A0A4V5UU98_9BACT|nr:6,7-dimethyl-8-ribityllumazine synthase [Ilyomonas limi]TKK68233.1 6,7-dimethyl-8-ribityllumazine synthase [Ilyomonas limi]
MATQGNTTLHKGIPQIGDAFVVIVKTEWNAHIVDKLEDGAIKVLSQQGARYQTLVVPGAVEIAFAVKAFAQKSAQKADAFITLGTVIKGDTPHFDYVCKAVTEGNTALNLTLDVPVIFGVLTVNDEEQAIERIGGAQGHKGEEAAITALKMIALNQSIQ